MERKTCPACNGFAIKPCPWCNIDIRDETGKVISSKPGPGCRACWGRSILTCTQCDGKGYLSQDEIEVPERDPQEDDANKC